MGYEIQNVARSTARRCVAEINEATKNIPKNESKDHIRRPIILKQYSELEPYDISFSGFLWALGVVSGVIEER